MTNMITNRQIADKISNFYTIHRTALKGLVNTTEMPTVHYHILSILNEKGPMRMGEISDTMAISRPNLTPLVDKLVAQNYVERMEYKDDRLSRSS